MKSIRGFSGNNPHIKKALKPRGICKYCNGNKVIKDGFKGDKQQYKCKDCNHKFINLGHHTKMRYSRDIIDKALGWYYEGMSLRAVSRQLFNLFNVKISPSTIWRWIQKYVPVIKEFLQALHPLTGGTWHVDETCVMISGKKWW